MSPENVFQLHPARKYFFKIIKTAINNNNNNGIEIALEIYEFKKNDDVFSDNETLIWPITEKQKQESTKKFEKIVNNIYPIVRSLDTGKINIKNNPGGTIGEQSSYNDDNTIKFVLEKTTQEPTVSIYSAGDFYKNLKKLEAENKLKIEQQKKEEEALALKIKQEEERKEQAKIDERKDRNSTRNKIINEIKAIENTEQEKNNLNLKNQEITTITTEINDFGVPDNTNPDKIQELKTVLQKKLELYNIQKIGIEKN